MSSNTFAALEIKIIWNWDQSMSFNLRKIMGPVVEGKNSTNSTKFHSQVDLGTWQICKLGYYKGYK